MKKKKKKPRLELGRFGLCSIKRKKKGNLFICLLVYYILELNQSSIAECSEKDSNLAGDANAK